MRLVSSAAREEDIVRHRVRMSERLLVSSGSQHFVFEKPFTDSILVRIAWKGKLRDEL